MKHILILSLTALLTVQAQAGGAGGSWGEPTQPTTTAPTTDYTGGGKFGGGGAGGSWGNPVSCKFSSARHRIYTSATDVGNANCSHYRNGSLVGWHYTSPDVLIARGDKSGGGYPKCSGGGGGYITFTCDDPNQCPEGQYLKNGTCVPDDGVSDDEPTPDKDKDKDNKDDNKECDATCKCKAELEAIRQAILNLRLDVDLSRLESQLNTIIELMQSQQQVQVDLSNIESKLSQIHQAILNSKYDDTELQAKINSIADELKSSNQKLDTIISLIEQNQTCNTEFNRKICEWLDAQIEQPEVQQLEITEVTLNGIDRNRISFDKTCPSNLQIPINYLGYSKNLSFDFAPICKALNLLKPVIIFAGSLSALFILLGVRRARSND